MNNNSEELKSFLKRRFGLQIDSLDETVMLNLLDNENLQFQTHFYCLLLDLDFPNVIKKIHNRFYYPNEFKGHEEEYIDWLLSVNSDVIHRLIHAAKRNGLNDVCDDWRKFFLMFLSSEKFSIHRDTHKLGNLMNLKRTVDLSYENLVYVFDDKDIFDFRWFSEINNLIKKTNHDNVMSDEKKEVKKQFLLYVLNRFIQRDKLPQSIHILHLMDEMYKNCLFFELDLQDFLEKGKDVFFNFDFKDVQYDDFKMKSFLKMLKIFKDIEYPNKEKCILSYLELVKKTHSKESSMYLDKVILDLISFANTYYHPEIIKLLNEYIIKYHEAFISSYLYKYEKRKPSIEEMMWQKKFYDMNVNLLENLLIHHPNDVVTPPTHILIRKLPYFKFATRHLLS